MPSEQEIKESLSHFDFESEPLDDETLVLTCRRVWLEGASIRYVYHRDDGVFQFLCGGYEHTSTEEALTLHVAHLYDRGPEQLRDFAFLRRGCYAVHLEGETWELYRRTPFDES